MKNTQLKFFLALFLITLTSTYSLQKKQFECEPYPYSRVALKHREHKGVGWDKGYTTLSLFLAPRNNHVLVPFLDARFHAFNNGYIASNLGVGARFTPISDDFVVGFNTYYDFREYKSFSSHQASGGIEFLTSAFDFRLNGYYPFSGKTEEKDVYFHQFRKNSAYLRQDILYSLPSADAEIGFELPEPMKQVQLYLAFGGYYLFKTHANNHSIGNAIGYKARLTATPEDYISFGVEYTHDRLFNNRVNGYISFQVPLGKKKAKTKSKHKYYKHRNECDSYYTGMRRKTQDPYHNEIIPFYDETHTFNADRITTNPNHFIFVNNTNLDPQEIGSGSGTFEDPYTTLKLGQINSSPGDIIYVFYGRGNDDGYNKGFVFQANQLLTSSGIDLNYNGFVIPAYTPGKLPFVTNRLSSSNSTCYALDTEQTILQGFNLSSINSETILFTNAEAIIRYNNITTPAGYYSFVHRATKDSTISYNTFNQGIDVDGSSLEAKNYTITNNQFHIQNGNAINLLNPAISLLISNNQFFSTSINNKAIAYERHITKNIATPISTTYRNNDILEGFEYGIFHQFSSVEKESTNIINNTISSPTRSIFAASYSYVGALTISENLIRNAQESIKVYFLSNSNITSYIEKNNITSSPNLEPSISLEVFSQGKTYIENNILALSKDGISITNFSPQQGLFSFAILNNNIGVSNCPINITNAFSSMGSTYGTIENNRVLTNTGGQGINLIINPSAKGNICATIIGNHGFFDPEIVASTDSTASGKIVIKCNPPATTNSLISQNPGFLSYAFSGHVSISEITQPCPNLLSVIYVNNNNKNPNPNGSLTNPWPTLLQAQQVSVAGDIIYVFPGDGSTRGYDQGFTLKDGQTIGSPAVTFTANGITFPSDGSSPPKITASSGSVIKLANNTQITGLSIIPNLNTSGIANDAILAGVKIVNNSFSMNGSSNDSCAIYLTKAIDGTISNNQITLKTSSQSSSAIGIGIDVSDAPNLTLSDNTIYCDQKSTALFINAQNGGNAAIERNNIIHVPIDYEININASNFELNFQNNNIISTSNSPTLSLDLAGTSSLDFYGNTLAQANSCILSLDGEFLTINKFNNNTLSSQSGSLGNKWYTSNSCILEFVDNSGLMTFDNTTTPLQILEFHAPDMHYLENSNPNMKFDFGKIVPTFESPCGP